MSFILYCIEQLHDHYLSSTHLVTVLYGKGLISGFDSQEQGSTEPLNIWGLPPVRAKCGGGCAFSSAGRGEGLSPRGFGGGCRTLAKR